MNVKEFSLKIERFLRFINRDEEHYTSSIEAHPWEEILCALTKAKSQYPTKIDMIQLYIDRYSGMSDKSLNALIENGYDIEGLISDLNRLTKILVEE